MASLKTPGVYLELTEKLPVLVEQLETAMPAFIGYTEKAEEEGQDLTNTAFRISNLAEYEQYFGGAPSEMQIEVELDQMSNYSFSDFSLLSSTASRYYMYDSLRLYFDNGGSDCIIVSVGDYDDQVDEGDENSPALNPGLRVGLHAMRKEQEVTLYLFPDAVNLDQEDFANLQKMALTQCAHLRDRFCILDLQEEDGFTTAVDNFREDIGTANLKYGAAYGPWVQHGYDLNISFRNLTFVDTLSIGIDLGNLTPEDEWNRLVTDLDTIISDVDSLHDEIEGVTGDPDIGVVDQYEILEAAYLDGVEANIPAPQIRTRYRALLNYAADIVKLFPVWIDQGLPATQSLRWKKLIKEIYNLFGKGYADKVETLIAFLSNADIQTVIYNGNPATYPNFTSFDDDTLLEDTVDSVAANTSTYGATVGDVCANSQSDFFDIWNEIVRGVLKIVSTGESMENSAQETLFSDHPILSEVIEDLRFRMALMPVSGLMAGIYSRTDAARGVWKAPAGMEISEIKGLARYINNKEQEGLNVDPGSGKSINMLRAFPGRGIRVHGGRTLAGNDTEWRYISVRRLFLSMEKSISQAVAPVIFESNDPNTWLKIKLLINAYLGDLWSKGAFRGTTPNDAYFILVGLGESMTQNDIDEGRLIVEIGVAAVRPAEFIKVTFNYLMQK